MRFRRTSAFVEICDADAVPRKATTTCDGSAPVGPRYHACPRAPAALHSPCRIPVSRTVAVRRVGDLRQPPRRPRRRRPARVRPAPSATFVVALVAYDLTTREQVVVLRRRQVHVEQKGPRRPQNNKPSAKSLTSSVTRASKAPARSWTARASPCFTKAMKSDL